MTSEKSFDPYGDWELDSDYYNDVPKKELNFEDFLGEDEPSASEVFSSNSSNRIAEELARVTAHVKQVREFMELGKDIDEICASTGFSKDYITTIEVTLLNVSEDDSDEAVAHLVMMG